MLPSSDFKPDFSKGLIPAIAQDSKDGGNHLNYSGALKVTSDFGEKLQNDLNIQASRLTPELQQKWEKDYEHFHTRIAGPAAKAAGK